ncbi:hypothetical protein Gotur_029687 [Gossypium turneri]
MHWPLFSLFVPLPSTLELIIFFYQEYIFG